MVHFIVCADNVYADIVYAGIVYADNPASFMPTMRKGPECARKS
jgi:hypothetical protein